MTGVCIFDGRVRNRSPNKVAGVELLARPGEVRTQVVDRCFWRRCRESATMATMFGGVVIIAVIAVIIPVLVLASSSILAALLGAFLVKDAENRYEGSELLDTNV